MIASALLTSPQGRLRAGWRALAFLLVLTVFLVFAGPAGAVLGSLAGAEVVSPALRTKLIDAGIYTATAVAALAANWVMLRFVDGARWSYVSLDRGAARPRRIGIGVCAGTLAIGVPCIVLIAAGWLDLRRFSSSTMLSPGVETLLALLVLVPAALAEELMMRGYLLSAIADGIGRWWALIVTSVVFALLHLRNPGMNVEAFAVVALAGVFLGAVRYATRSLYAAWGAHLAWNAVLGLLLHALVSGTIIAGSRWQTVDSGPDWATGGAWGPEGGAAALLGLLAATSLLIIRRPRVAGSNDTANA